MLLENCENSNFINNTFIGCGKCPNCFNKKRNEWSIRLEHELIENGGKGAFITLTYNQENLVRTGTKKIVEGDELGTLVKPHLQKFFKKLRKKLEKDKIKIKYIAAGEYGTAFKRPHYHIILLGINGNHFNQNEWEKLWGHGKVDVDTRKISAGCICYINSYIKKDSLMSLEDKINFEKEYNRVAPFITQSQGIGKAWAIKNANGWTKTMQINYNGYTHGIPRYYIKTIKKLEGKTIKIKKTTINHYKNITIKNNYTYYKVLENINGKYTKQIIEKSKEIIIKNLKEMKDKINDNEIEKKLNIIENEYYKKLQNNFELFEMNEKELIKNTKSNTEKIMYKTLKQEQQKAIATHNIKKILGKKLTEYYRSRAKAKNDIIRIKIEKTKRNYDKNEKEEYIKRKIKKLLDKNEKTGYKILKINLIKLGGKKNYERFERS